MIRAIFFDCFGVLATDVWRQFLDQLPQTADTSQAPELIRALDMGMISIDDFRTAVHDAMGKYPPDLDALEASSLAKNTQLLAMIRELHGSYKIGIISNISSDWVRQTLLTPEECSLFDDMVFSYDVHLAKPDPEIFNVAAARLSVPPGECLFIDDSQGHCQGAMAVGMQAIQYRSWQQARAAIDAALALANPEK